MRERAIPEDEVYEIFEHPVLIKKREATLIVGRTRQRRFLTLVMDSKLNKLLTLWPSNRSERRLYSTRFGL